jgi:enoyl-CoA hydratase/carnithine racemase
LNPIALIIVGRMETLLIERADGVVTITLNRPERKNAINDTMWNELLATFRDLHESAAQDRVVVITGAGGAFCSGADIGGAPSNENGLASMRHVGDVCLALHALPQPVIAKVVGVAAGAGLNLALGCDLIVASDDARFSEIFARRGLSVDFGGSWVLPRLVGLHKAKELVLFADILSAREAQDVGIVNRVLPAGEVDAFVDEWAARLASGPPLALTMSKRLLNQSSSVSLAQALEAEALAQNVNFGSKDTTEAMLAFVEKREPHFQGR